jgi:coenzyme F420-reducing hydrogenase delta subunit
MGLSGDRIMMGFCSAAEGQKFQQVATQFDKDIKQLGPSPLRGNDKRKKK